MKKLKFPPDALYQVRVMRNDNKGFSTFLTADCTAEHVGYAASAIVRALDNEKDEREKKAFFKDMSRADLEFHLWSLIKVPKA